MEKKEKFYYAKYSVLSRGSEEKGKFNGYIWIGENDGDWILTQNEHGTLKTIPKNNVLKCNKSKNIKNIAIARFQLMAAIMMKRNKTIIKKKSNILLVGLGNVGLGTILELVRLKRKNISILLRNNNKKCIIDELNKRYKANIKIVNSIEEIDKFDNVIDATGNKEILDEIINKIGVNTNLFLIGTPREGPQINILSIHRKNIRLIGAHEINGITEKERQKLFTKSLKSCSKLKLHSLDRFIKIHEYSKTVVNESILDRSHIIHIFKYKEEE